MFAEPDWSNTKVYYKSKIKTCFIKPPNKQSEYKAMNTSATQQREYTVNPTLPSRIIVTQHPVSSKTAQSYQMSLSKQHRNMGDSLILPNVNVSTAQKHGWQHNPIKCQCLNSTETWVTAQSYQMTMSKQHRNMGDSTVLSNVNVSTAQKHGWQHCPTKCQCQNSTETWVTAHS